nr:MAG TPA: hypothetical protein [Microviridae sp.]
MKEKIKQFIKENWISLVLILVLIVVISCQGCGSTWRITGNTVNVNNKCQNDSITHHNDSNYNEIRQIP